MHHTRHIYSIDIYIYIYIYVYLYIYILYIIYTYIYIFMRSSNSSTVIAGFRHSSYRTWSKEPISQGFLGHWEKFHGWEMPIKNRSFNGKIMGKSWENVRNNGKNYRTCWKNHRTMAEGFQQAMELITGRLFVGMGRKPVAVASKRDFLDVNL